MAAGAQAYHTGGRSRIKESLYAYGYIAPAILAMVVASFVPIAFTVFVAFTNWDQRTPRSSTASISSDCKLQGNLRQSASGAARRRHLDPRVCSGQHRNQLWTRALPGLPPQQPAHAGAEPLPNDPDPSVGRPRGRHDPRLDGTAGPDFGQVNNFLGSINLPFWSPGRPDWLGDPNTARIAVIMVNTWFGYPFMMTACLGALQSIPAELGEAAQVDGAGTWVRFRRITFPLLRSATLPLIISTFAYNLNNFGAIYLLTGGGPRSAGKMRARRIFCRRTPTTSPSISSGTVWRAHTASSYSSLLGG